MDVLSESMRRATETAPPSRIDLDALIAGEHRRHRWVTAGGSTLAIAVVLAGLVVVAPLAGGGHAAGIAGVSPTDPCAPIAQTRTPTAAPRATDGPQGEVATLRPPPTEPAAAAEARLSRAFDQALKAAAPGMTFADFRRPGCELVQFANFGDTFLYEGMALATDSGGTGGIAVHFYLRPVGRPTCDAASCSYDWIQDLPDGTIAWGIGNAVHVWRPDGTANMLLAVDSGTNSAIPRITQPVSRAQLIAIGIYPRLTLYP